ncbi:hypothetical protein [Pseudoduganella violacea]|uniref:Uncharacterized protein n=1 Tax=Pseudoduganella violacea TaxID=1715466 RepID=A0A7W5BGH3_9BURK|nr:hypothetical protein [Pseudoduganella violacea]MBB3121815.1 hypothetical protein [Pseudoduganella violacea]
METSALQARLYQAFLRGYSEFPGHHAAAASARAPAGPSPAMVAGAALESRELRRSIDACQHALSQMAELPEAEREQLRSELRATLDHLVKVSEQLLTQLRAGGEAPAAADASASEDPSDLPPSPSTRGKKPPRRR